MQNKKFLMWAGALVVLLIVVNVVVPGKLKSIFDEIGVGPQQAQALQTLSPINYWQFESSSNPKAATIGSTAFPISDANSTFYKTSAECNRGAANGGCGEIKWNSGVGSMSIASSANLTLEYTFKLNPKAETAYFFRDTNTGNYGSIDWPANGAYGGASISFSVNGDELKVPFDGINSRDWSVTLGADKWHHVAFVYGSGGYKAIYIDGMKLGEKTGGSGNFASSGSFYFGWSSVEYRMPNMVVDEIMFTPVKMDPLWIYQHYKDSVVDGLAYKTQASQINVSSVPEQLPITAAADPMQFPPGHPTVTAEPDVRAQLYAFPSPRFNPNYSLPKNFPWLDYQWSGERNQAGINDNASTTDANSGPLREYKLQKELATNWNFMLNLPLASGSKDCYAKMLTDLANENPNFQVGTIGHRAQPGGTNSWDLQTYNSKFYLQNASGTNLLVSPLFGGSNTVKSVRPVMYSDSVATYRQQGDNIRGYIQGAASAGGGCAGFAALTNSIDLINENGELSTGLPMTFRDMSADLGSQDPVVVSQKAVYAGASGWTMAQFVAEMFKNLTVAAYRDILLAPMTIGGNPIIDSNTVYTEYALDGYPQYRWDWSTVKQLNTRKDPDGSYYSTPDFYPKVPSGWLRLGGAFHGVTWIDEARRYEIAKGDNFFTPFTSAGYNPGSPGTPDTDVRPAQWLGLLKIMTGFGAKAFYPGFFDETAPTTIIHPKTYMWQFTTAGYAQAAMSKFGTAFNTSKVIQDTAGNKPQKYVPSPSATDSLFLATGDTQVLAIARESGTKKMIVTNWNQNHNYTLPTDRRAKNITINVKGENLQVETRVQGSMYVYDNANTAAPIFYQLDKWHEYNGPWYWSTDSQIEAELMDSGSATIKTEGPGVAARNFTPGNYDTYVAPASGTLGYKFQQRDATGTGTSGPLYFWYRARTGSGSAATASVKVDSGTSSTLSVSSSTFGWCNKNSGGQVISFPGVTRNVDHTLNFTGANANFYFDQFVITTNPNLGLGTCTGGGGGSADTISPTIGITAPATGGTYSTAATPLTTLAGTAADNTAVTLVTWSNTTTGTSGQATGTTSWSIPSVALQSGANTISISASDAAGNSASTQIVVTYTPADTTAPTVSIVNPVATGGTYLATANTLTTLSGNAADNIGVTQVTWTNSLGGGGSATGTNSWTVPSITLSNGANVITVTAKDAANNVKTASITVNRDSQAPAAAMTVPSNGASIVGTSPVTLTASVTDNVGIDHVDFYYGTSSFIGGATSVVGSNYSRTWTPSASGNTTLFVKAYDTSGNITTSATISVSITLSVPDTIAPTVTMSGPTAGSTVSGASVTLGAVATDNTGVSSVAFYLDGVAISGAIDITGNNPNTNSTAITGQLYEAVWNASSVSNGTHTISAKATDAAGNSTTSATISLTVANGSVDLVITGISTVPSTPAAGGNVKFVATVKNQGAIASPADKITSVAFSVDGVYTSCGDGYMQAIPAGGTITVTAGDTSSASSNWCNNTLTGGQVTPNWVATEGTHTILANVDDINRIAEGTETNNTLTSSIVVSVAADTTAPGLSITSPNSNGTLSTTSGVLTTLGGTASDAVGVTQVTWSNNRGGSGVASGTTAWSVPSINLQSGSNVITVKAYDAAGNNSSKNFTVSYTVQAADTIAPTIAITTPTSSSTYTSSGATLATLSGTASDNVSVTTVNWSNSLGGSGTATGTSSWAAYNIALQAGSNVITVTASDAAGNIASKTLTVTYTVQTVDTTAPNLTITSPANNSNVSNTSNTTFVATATDNSGVSEVKFFLGATSTTAKCTLTTTPTTAPSTYSCAIKVPSVFFGLSYSTINVQAKDAAGNITVKSVKVR